MTIPLIALLLLGTTQSAPQDVSAPVPQGSVTQDSATQDSAAQDSVTGHSVTGHSVIQHSSPVVSPPALRAAAQVPVEPEPQAPLVALDEVREHPTRWLRKPFRCVVQFHEARHDPALFSSFTPSVFWAFAAWSNEQRLWERPAYLDPAPRLFAQRGTAPAVLLANARRYERFELQAEVVEVLLGEPWIEVTGVERVEGSWNEGALVHATRAEALRGAGRWLLAADQYDRALAGRLPDDDRLQMEELRDGCRKSHARREEARRNGNSSIRLLR